VNGSKIADDAINSEHYAAASIDFEHLADNSVDSRCYVDGSIDAAHLASDSVTEAKMAANSVDSDSYVNYSIDAVHIADDQINSQHYAADSIDTEHYAPGSIDATALASDSVTEVKMAANSVDSQAYVDGSIDTAHIADGQVTLAKTTGLVGKNSIWVPAQAMAPTTTNGCSALTTVETTSGRPDMNVLDFDKDSDEFAQFSIAFPKMWNLGTVTFQVFWSGIAATTDCDWSVQGVAMNDNQTIDVAYGTAVVVTDNAQGAVEELLVSAESGAVTIAGTPADNDLTYFRIGRDVSGDAMAGDARLHGIKIFFTTDALTDA